MISRRSRYANSPTALVKSPRGDVITVMPKDPAATAINFTYMYLQQGDRLDLIARRILGDDTLWWRIADANPEIIDWTNVKPGTLLRIPSA